MVNLSETRNVVGHYLTEPVARLLARTSITPCTITWLGFLLAIGAAALISIGHLFAAGFVVLIAGFFDMLDGALARRTNQTTFSGAVLDSTLDRLSDAVVLLGVLIFYLFSASQPTVEILLVCLALISVPLVSYVRARAEVLGLKCQVGLFTRTERVIVLALGLLLSHFSYALIVALAIIAAFSFFTAGQRLFYVWQQIKTR